MAILSDINSALEKMDAACFQQLGDEMLKSIYRPINVESRGSKTGKAKTVKGSPDTIFSMLSGKILIEYTTQSNSPRSSFVKKLKSDILSCLNEKKTRIPLEDITKIILFSNQRIAIDIQEELKKFLLSKSHNVQLTIFSIDDISLKLREFPSLLQDYLGITSFPGLMEIDYFIKRASCSKFTYQTPLDNKYFEFDSQSISNGLKVLDTNDIIIISGDAGMGKTRYAIEVAKALSLNSDTKAYIIEEKNKNIREILDQVDKNSSFLFIIDDANRTAIWDEAIEFYKDSYIRNIKFIATVRSYAIDTVVAKCSAATRVKEIVISQSPDELASKILTSFGITNPLWHKRINDITGKNIRLAVMCAQIAMAGEKYNELLNVEGVYDAYYTPLFGKLTSDYSNRSLIKVAAIISFYKIVDLEEESLLSQIEEFFCIKKSEFISLCHELHISECINITEYGIATIPDQNFGTYLFYQCFFVLKEFSLSRLIIRLRHRRERLRDSLFSVWNCFHKKDVMDFLRISISTAWRELDESIKDERDKFDFIEVFGGIIPSVTFSYINSFIQDLALGNKKSSTFNSDKIISILSQFSHSGESNIKTSLALVVEYLKVRPNKIEEASKVISDHWLYDEIDYATSYKRLTTIIENLIELSSESEIGFLFASRILPNGLKFIYQYTRTKGRNFVVGRHAVIVTEELKNIRIKIWLWINQYISNVNQSVLIEELYNDFYEIESIAKELIKNELVYLKECIGKLNIAEDFNLCVNLANFGKRIKRIMNKECLDINWSIANSLYKLDCQIKKGCEQRIIREYEIEQNNINQIVQKKTLQELKHLVEGLSQISTIKGIMGDFRVSYVIESVLKKSVDKGLELWQYCINQNLHFIASRIISIYVQCGYDIPKLTNFVSLQKWSIKSELILAFTSVADNSSKYISNQHFCEAIRYHKDGWYTMNSLCEKYYTGDEIVKGYRSVMVSLLLRIRDGLPISGSEEFLINFAKYYKSKIGLVGMAYIHGIKLQDSFDYKHELLQCILLNNPNFWVECCVNIPSFASQYHICPYEFIWDMENAHSIIELTLLYYASKGWIPYDEKENLSSFFCNLRDDKAANFIDEMIAKYNKDRHISDIIFEIVATHMGDFRVRHFVTFITHNTSIENFKSLDLFSHSMYGGDSFAPAIKSRLDFIESLIETIKELKNGIKYLEHLEYLTVRKESLEREYNFELKRGHKHRLYDL